MNLHWSVSNLQVSWALRDLPCLKVMLHKCAGYIFQLIRCTQDWCRYKSGDGATKHLSQGYFHQCILGLQILVCFTSNFPSLPAQNHTHGRAVLQAEWASIMWSPRCINSSSRRRLSHLITLNQTNVDERWRERGEGGGGGGGVVWRDLRGMSWLSMSKRDTYARCRNQTKVAKLVRHTQKHTRRKLCC